MNKKFGILVGGGPAPGINSVIGAATIKAINAGIEVVGIRDGFEHIAQGDTDEVTTMKLADISRIHFGGGSYLGISRFNPTKEPEHLKKVVDSLIKLEIGCLITIGGDDTAYSAYRVEKASEGKIRVVHVPKTIDNDLALPYGISTFGFQTARHVGVNVVKSIMVDAHTTRRWYFLVSMGRKAGHLALGIGKAAGATLTLISEQFSEEKIKLDKLVDILTLAILKRESMGRPDGVVLLAEGLVLHIDVSDLTKIPDLERDAHDNIRIANLNLGDILKERVLKRLDELGNKTTIVSKNIGYELRCADPIPFDMEYTRDLGYCASQHLIDGGNRALISIQGAKFVPIGFDDIMDPETGKMQIRMVDINSESYQIASQYMIRADADDFNNPDKLGRIAGVVNMPSDEFAKKFSYVLN